MHRDESEVLIGKETKWQPEYKPNEEGIVEMPSKKKKVWTTIGISLETKIKLDKLKKDESYEKFINKTIDTDKKVNLVVELVKRLDKLETQFGSLERFIKNKSGGQYG